MLVRLVKRSISKLHGACSASGLEIFQRCCVWSLAGRGIAPLGFQTGEKHSLRSAVKLNTVAEAGVLREL